jgi:hypothetical protein
MPCGLRNQYRWPSTRRYFSTGTPLPESRLICFDSLFWIEVRGGRLGLHNGSSSSNAYAVLNAIQFACDELELGVRIGDATVVYERDPAVEIASFLVSAEGENVIGAPVHIAREIRGLDALRFGAAIFEHPDERWAAVEIFRQVGKAVGIDGHAGDDFVADLPHGTAIIG